MRRYAFNGNVSETKQYFDVIIIGSGIAGLYTALNLDENISCAVVSKAQVEKSNSWLAQGGIAAVISEEDQFESHFEDTIKAGAGLCDHEAVSFLVKEGPENIKKLISMNVPFDVNAEGDLLVTREGGHTKNRIVHCGGDATGRETVKTLAAIAERTKNITILENLFLVDIITDNEKAVGVILYDHHEYKIYLSTKIVISTGGIGQVFKSTTNPLGATGDGIAAAIRAGAETKNMEFVQFHPTALYNKDNTDQFFLISEAVRGEGGILKNHEGTCFMENVHPMKDLAPRDIVARAIDKELKRTADNHVFLDITSKDKEFLSKRFPTIYNECLSKGIEMSEQYIPVCPVQHFLMGGLKTDLNGMSTIEGLYVCGEAACTGVHGANRLASNSLLECLVFGRQCASHINQTFKQSDEKEIQYRIVQQETVDGDIDIFEERRKIQNTMTEKCGIIRNEKKMTEGLGQIRSILADLKNLDMTKKEYTEVFNMAMVAQEILQAAINRKNSVGAHYRDDVLIDKR